MVTNKKRDLNTIIIHCSDSDNPKHDNVHEIRKWHLVRGFSDIGYHFFIDKSGSVARGRPVSMIGAHCKGHNTDSIGICLSGKENFTNDQLVALGCLLMAIWGDHGDMPVFPHNKFTSEKTCPNIELNLFASTK